MRMAPRQRQPAKPAKRNLAFFLTALLRPGLWTVEIATGPVTPPAAHSPPIPTPTPTSHRRTFSEEQRGQWETKRAEIYADKPRLEQSKAALAEKIRDLHKKVDLVPRVFTRLGFVGQTTETSRIYDEGRDKVADVHDAINETADRTGRCYERLIGEPPGSPRPPPCPFLIPGNRNSVLGLWPCGMREFGPYFDNLRHIGHGFRDF